ncbi:MAG: hypothetical protein WD830_03170 [Chloroflexota bacterium]
MELAVDCPEHAHAEVCAVRYLTATQWPDALAIAHDRHALTDIVADGRHDPHI